MIDTQVLIIGGGPVGLSLALDLGWRGIDCVLIEQGDGSVDQPKLGLVNVRSMEHCRRWGITQQIIDCPHAKDYQQNIVFATSLAGYELARQDYPSFADTPPSPFSPERHQRCSQLWFDPILCDAARARDSVTLRHNCRFESFTEDDDGVTVTVTDTLTGSTSTIRSAYMVGCDGAASQVRNALGYKLEGRLLSHSINVFFRLPQMWQHFDKGQAERYILIGPAGTWANITAIDGRELWRLSLAGDKTPVDLASFDADAALRRAFGTDLDYELLSVGAWTRLEMVADHFQRGRVLMAGDAVHCFSPTGGFGANTGVGDSVDLGWKLAAVLSGWGGAQLLDSYESERRPIALRNTAEAARNFSRFTSAGDNPNLLENTVEGQQQREAVGELVRSQTQKEWETLGVQLGYRYEDSPLCLPDGTPPPPDDSQIYVPSARPGSRAPHVWLDGDRSILDHFGDGFVLLSFDFTIDTGSVSAAARTNMIPFSVVEIADPEAASLYQRKLVLVRPDGHVAWRGDDVPTEPAPVLRRVTGH